MRSDASMQERAYETARRTISTYQVASRLGKEPRAHVHRARQVANQDQTGDHRRARKNPSVRVSTNEQLSKYGFFADWTVEPKWNLCDRAGTDNGGKGHSLGAFFESSARCWSHPCHVPFRGGEIGVEKFDTGLSPWTNSIMSRPIRQQARSAPKASSSHP